MFEKLFGKKPEVTDKTEKKSVQSAAQEKSSKSSAKPSKKRILDSDSRTTLLNESAAALPENPLEAMRKQKQQQAKQTEDKPKKKPKPMHAAAEAESNSRTTLMQDAPNNGSLPADALEALRKKKAESS